MHPQAVSFRKLLNADGIIKITRVIPVDRDRQKIAQIMASFFDHRVIDGIRHIADLFQRFRGKFSKDIMLDQQGKDIDAWIVFVAQHSGDMTLQLSAI